MIRVLIMAIGLLPGLVYGGNLTDSSKQPQEVLALRLPEKQIWREINRIFREHDGVFECVPESQNAKNWSELLCFQYHDRDQLKGNDLDKIVHRIHSATKEKYPGAKVLWKVLEKNKEDQIYEWVLEEKYENIPRQHEIVRVFLTNKGFHRVGFTRRHAQMESKERDQWIKTLKTAVSIVSSEEALNIPQALSIADGCKNLFNLAPFFQNWKVINRSADGIYSLTCLVPPHYKTGDYVDECLEIVMLAAHKSLSSDHLLQASLKVAESKTKASIHPSIYYKKPKDVLFSYAYPQDHLQVTVVEKLFMVEDQHYCLRYKRGLAQLPPDRTVIQWKNQLDSIQMNPISELLLVPKFFERKENLQ